MKVWQIPSFGIEKLEQNERPMPKPARGQVLIKVHAVSLNYRDLLVVLGKYNPRLTLPRIPCSDGAGEIVAVGEDVIRWKTGQRVAAIFMQNWIEGSPDAAKQRGALGGDIDGMLAEYVLLDQRGLVEVPAHLSWEEAATLPCAAVTAWNAVVHAGNIRPGDTVLIQGTGGVSIFALQFAKLAGARVLGTSSSDEKLRRAHVLGLDSGVNYKRTPEWATWVLDQTGGAGADLVVEVGGAGTLMQSLKAVRVGGVVAQIGVLSQSVEPFTIFPILHKQVHLQGIYVGSRADFEEMNRAIAVHSLHPVVDEVFAFADSQKALRTLESGSHFGKLVVGVHQ
ncbi:MAG: NAD(P)-dependent alcohol dehydrogenase [Acidobacteriaceae bacterium]|nr:NAD(P)-dependent alcohol dehydrogenase [Acidobacteriaceae bacterium]